MGTKSHRRARGRALSEDEEAGVQDVEVQADEAANASSSPAPLPLDDPGFVDFAVTGTPASGEFRCADCGYGAVVRRVLPPCPMCGGTVWESRGLLGPRVLD
jgi:rubrerythrin